jgi:hypothetical protein
MFVQGGHECETVGEAGFSSKENGELLDLADARFDVLVTIDKNLKYQQNLTGRRIAILIIRAASNDIDDIRPHVPAALATLRNIQPGRVEEVGNLS